MEARAKGKVRMGRQRFDLDGETHAAGRFFNPAFAARHCCSVAFGFAAMTRLSLLIGEAMIQEEKEPKKPDDWKDHRQDNWFTRNDEDVIHPLEGK